ncbi:MAG TPA: hypothetical protein VI959_03175 [Alphaproteobacteria bacterium]|nr:hypothetical protein [Alphaproteobacteria bacterium]
MKIDAKSPSAIPAVRSSRLGVRGGDPRAKGGFLAPTLKRSTALHGNDKEKDKHDIKLEKLKNNRI